MNLNDFKLTLAAGLVSLLAATTAPAAEKEAATGQQETTVQRTVRVLDSSRLSPDLVSLAKLVQSGVGDKVVLTYIQKAPPKRNPTAEELVYLHELGLSSEGMVALMNAVPKVSVTEITPSPAPIVQPLHAQRADEPGGRVQNAPTVVTQAPAQSAPVSGSAVISSPAPTVVYTQPTPSTFYVEQPPVVTYVEPYPRFSFGLDLGHHIFGHHFGGHHSGGHHGRHHFGGHGGGHHGRHH